MSKKVTLFELTSPEAAELFKKTKTVLMPFGSIEHHGPHLPLGTDGMDAYVVAKRIAEKTEAIVAPLMQVGVSQYFMDWPGTMTVKTETYAKFVEEMTLSLVHHGLKNIVYIIGHGGNKQGLEIAANNVQMESDATVMLVLCFRVPAVVLPGKMDMGHGGRVETNAVLAYDPELVNREGVTVKPGWEEAIQRINRIRGRERGDIYGIMKNFRTDGSEEGWFGDPLSANVEEAHDMVDKVADDIIVYMEKKFGSAAMVKKT